MKKMHLKSGPGTIRHSSVKLGLILGPRVGRRVKKPPRRVIMSGQIRK